MTLLSAVAPNRDIVAVYTQLKDTSSKRFIIKCYDANVSRGSLKFTLSANLKDQSTKELEVVKLLFPSNDCLLALLSNNTILVFDLGRGVHVCTIESSQFGGELCAFTGKDNLVYALIRKEGKSLILAHDIEKKGKIVNKIKSGSCDEDDRLGIAVHPSQDKVAVLIGKKMKIIQVSNGETSHKFKIKGEGDGKISHGESPCILTFASDGEIVLVSTTNHVYLFSLKSGNNIGTVPISTISRINIHSNQDTYIATIISNQSKASFIEVNPSGKKNATIKPFSTITLPTSKDNGTIISDVFFSSGKQAEDEVTLLELTQLGLVNVDVSISQVQYRNESTELKGGELYPTPSQEQSEVDKQSKKRKKTASNNNIVLGPGESGGEALTVTDQTTVKRPKIDKNGEVEEESDDDVDFSLETGDEAEESIAQRLALLSSEIDRDTEDEEELLKIQNDASNKNNLIVKTATSDSLVILLRQALLANDDAQLEVALQVSDKKIIENSIMALSHESPDENDDEDAKSEIVIMLLTKLVTRLSRKPARAQRLAFWIRTVLVALISKMASSSSKMGKAERDIAARLGPLRNLLSERVESLPDLLRLEGRLSLLSK
mmetsp:Transcript_5392/g.6902  ORF Transcript_5392/g.6902 Transcript_5392/m.6902 type:complete len:605 (+) Transcript_5392:103-1917(+)